MSIYVISYFVTVFAYVGGTYFFLVGSFNFVARLINIVMTRVIKFMHRKAEPHVNRIRGFSMNPKKPLADDNDSEADSDEELLNDNEDDPLIGGGAVPRSRPLSDDMLVTTMEK